MNRCATCRWWDPPSSWEIHNGKYVYIVRSGDPAWGECDLLGSVHEDALGFACGREESGFVTHETFGCVQWEPKTSHEQADAIKEQGGSA